MKDNAPKTGEELYQKLIDKLKSMPRNTDISLVEKAYKVAKEAHGAQARESGEPYIIHPLSVALILTDFELDNSAVAAAILHDVVEDTSYDIDYIKKEFGNEIAVLVDGVTKLGKIQFNSKEEQQAENFRKMLLAMAQDIRVILIKLADRLHNMRTLKYLPEDRQKRNAQETLDIYAPIAHRLGMYKIKWELEDLSLRYIDPKGYYELVSEINQKRDERETYIAIIIATLQERLKMLGIEADIEGRPKHFYSIYNKMKKQNKTIEQIYDLFAVRVIVNTVAECYTVLGMVHEMYKPIPNRFKDYISLPKQNMYRSLHTTVIGPQGQPFEVQIRTWEMHHVAETGIAAHWRYKEDNNNLGNDKDMDTKLAWLRQLLDVQKDTNDAKEFMDNLKINLFTDEVFVFTPKGDVVTLPANSTPIDFAYNIHSQIGNKMMGARVNGKIVTLNYILRNGDIVEILTSSNVQGPSRDWLKIAKSSTARNKITQWFKKEGKEQNILIGKDIVEREAKKLGMNPSKLFKESDLLYDILGKIGYQSLNDVFSSVGYGSLAPIKFLGRFKEELDKENEKSKTEAETLESMQNKLQKENEKQAQNKRRASSNGIIVKGVENCLVRLAKCCNPIPGEPIVGYITRGRGISVHRKNCSNIKELMDIEPRAIEVEWAGTDEAVYNVNLEVKASDNSGLLIGISNAVNEPKSRLKAINARTVDDIAIMTISLEIKSAEQLTRIIKNINAVKGVFEVVRVNN